jgi:hypothetical protein
MKRAFLLLMGMLCAASVGAAANLPFPDSNCLAVTAPAVIYVDAAAAGNRDGTSWQHAFGHLQDALAEAGCGSEIRIAQGTYTPDTNTADPTGSGDSGVSFRVEFVSDLSIKGGYAGVSGTDPNMRRIDPYVTILSGDLLGNDPNGLDPDLFDTDPSRSDNSESILQLDTAEHILLDGLTIQGANGDGWFAEEAAIAGHQSTFTVRRCRVLDNVAGLSGMAAGIEVHESRLERNRMGVFHQPAAPITLIDTVFAQNTVGAQVSDSWGGNGGGVHVILRCQFTGNGEGLVIYPESGASGVMIEQCDFLTNGGGISDQPPPLEASTYLLITDCRFEGNGPYAALEMSFGTKELFDCTFVNNVDGSAIYQGTHCSVWAENCLFQDNSSASFWDGGGAIGTDIAGHAGMTLIDCNFLNNTALSDGGAVFSVWGDVHIEGSSFINNTSLTGTGGAVYVLSYNQFNVLDSTFRNNDAALSGGAVYQQDTDGPEASLYDHVLFVGNSSLEGGGLTCNGSLADFNDCTFASNAAAFGPAIACDSFEQSTPSSLAIANSILWNGSPPIGNRDLSAITIRFSDIEGGWAGEGNLNADPLLADAASGDVHLKSAYGRWDAAHASWVYDAVTSPCIDAGDPADSGWVNEPWPHGRRVNMGAYGGTAHASLSGDNSGTMADVNGDGFVNLDDYAEFSADWSKPPPRKSDFDLNGTVDLDDLLLFCEQWLTDAA